MISKLQSCGHARVAASAAELGVAPHVEARGREGVGLLHAEARARLELRDGDRRLLWW